ncbi:conserved hypothetical protein [Ricinus communis]|uniref:Uncharacterized protein n=1 Tax=Ricinus communis TaxID=3988 RepID=B9S569_RICCO|nr:conserved hypothetical protein [Ricinus communis]
MMSYGTRGRELEVCQRRSMLVVEWRYVNAGQLSRGKREEEGGRSWKTEEKGDWQREREREQRPKKDDVR